MIHNLQFRSTVARSRAINFVFALTVLAAPSPALAQLVIDPTTAEFQASSSHSQTDSNGVPIVDHYELEFFLIGAAQPFQVQPFGKPTPSGSGLITVSLASILAAFPSPGIVYDSTVAAVGPGGTARSAHSNTFQFSTPACTYGVSPTSRTLTSAAGSSTTAVTAAGGCTWTATSNAGWLTISGGASGNGNGTVTFTATANTSTSQRVGTLTVAGQAVTVTQSGAACTFGVSPTSRTLTSAAGSSTTAVTAAGGCAWTATSNAGWLTISGGASGNGNGTVTFTATANTSTTQRVGTLTVAGQPVTVTQSGAACTFGVSPLSATLTSAAGSSTTAVTAAGGCTWTATSNAGWLTISGGASGNGNGTVTFTATANTSTSQRVGTLTVAGQPVTVTQSGAACTFGVSPLSATLTSAAGSSTTAVTAAGGCTWTATSNAGWLTISGGASGNGNGTVTFTATANTSTSQRVGTLTVAGQPVTVTQNGTTCTYGVSPTSRTLTSAAGSSTTAVTAATGCAWTATSNAGWLTISGGASGNGNGTVTFTATANTSTSQRVGTLTVAGQPVTVTQSGAACTFGVSPLSATLTSAAGSSTTAVTAAGGCTWTATSNAGWLTISGGASGNGNGTVTFTATANTSTSQRVGTLTVAGQPVTVTQNGTTCTYGVSPTSRTLTSAAGSSTTAVTAATGCAWTATSNAGWLTISGGASGNGNGTVTFTATANTSTTQRVGTLTVAGQPVTVTQNGTTCTYGVSPTSRTLTSAGGSSTTAVTAASGCTWTASSNAPWLSVSGGATGSGNGTVTFNATTNSSTAQRVGTLTVAGQTVTVTQSGSACTFGINPTTRTVAAAGANSSTMVIVNSGGASCAWTATSNAAWLTITSGPTGVGSAPVQFTAAANTTTSQRVGTLTIAGQTLTVTQGAGTASGPSTPTNLRFTGQ